MFGFDHQRRPMGFGALLRGGFQSGPDAGMTQPQPQDGFSLGGALRGGANFLDEHAPAIAQIGGLGLATYGTIQEARERERIRKLLEEERERERRRDESLLPMYGSLLQQIRG